MVSAEKSHSLPHLPASLPLAPAPVPRAATTDAPAAPTAPHRSPGFGSFRCRLGDSRVWIHLKGHESHQSDIAGGKVEGPAVTESLERDGGEYRRGHPGQPSKGL